MKRIAKYETNDGHLFDTREEAAFLTRFLTRGGARSGIKTFKELIDLNNELNDETDE